MQIKMDVYYEVNQRKIYLQLKLNVKLRISFTILLYEHTYERSQSTGQTHGFHQNYCVHNHGKKLRTQYVSYMQLTPELGTFQHTRDALRIQK